ALRDSGPPSATTQIAANTAPVISTGSSGACGTAANTHAAAVRITPSERGTAAPSASNSRASSMNASAATTAATTMSQEEGAYHAAPPATASNTAPLTSRVTGPWRPGLA